MEHLCEPRLECRSGGECIHPLRARPLADSLRTICCGILAGYSGLSRCSTSPPLQHHTVDLRLSLVELAGRCVNRLPVLRALQNHAAA
jgi:hypothetical protein